MLGRDRVAALLTDYGPALAVRLIRALDRAGEDVFNVVLTEIPPSGLKNRTLLRHGRRDRVQHGLGKFLCTDDREGGRRWGLAVLSEQHGALVEGERVVDRRERGLPQQLFCQLHIVSSSEWDIIGFCALR